MNMKVFALSALLMLLQGASFAAAGPVERRNDKLDTPSVEQIHNEIKGLVEKDKSVFYTGAKGAGAAAFRFKKKHNMKKLQDLDPGDKKWNNVDLWKDHDMVVRHESQAFAEVSSGTVWVVFTSADEIDLNRPNTKSVWVLWEYPALIKNKDVDEIIQVDMKNLDHIQPIWPKQIRKAEGTCEWHGTAPECETKCPDGTTEYTTSKFGDNFEECTGEGRKRYCCKK